MTQKTRFVDKPLNSTTIRESEHQARQIAELAYALDGVAFIGGGAARWLTLGALAPRPSDIDVFCWRAENQRETQRRLESIGYRFVMIQGGAEAWTRNGEVHGSGSSEPLPHQDLAVQIVTPRGGASTQQRFGSPSDVLGDFTFICEQFAIYAAGPEQPLRQVSTREAQTDTKIKRIRFNKIASPIYATWRISKYSRKGFRISIAESQKLFAAWENLPVAMRGEMIAVDPFGGDVYRELGGIA